MSCMGKGMEPNQAKIEGLVRQLLIELGEDVNREGLLKTPARVARALTFLTYGYRSDVREVVNQALFTQPTGGMVIVQDTEPYSLSERHLLPYYGACPIA